MQSEPQIMSLSKKRRNLLFYLLVVVFLVALPSMIFYTTGYRLSFENEETSIVTTGGVYVTTDNLEVEVYLDEVQVEKPRLFRSAYYIQNIEIGQHRIVVQRPDLYTWVKDLPIDPHIVAEVAAFNMPLVPHARPITEFITTDNESVYQSVSTSTVLFDKSTTTFPFYATTSKATSTYTSNEEYIFVKSLFASTSVSEQSVFDLISDRLERFKFATTSEDIVYEEEKKIQNGVKLVQKDKEILAVWQNEGGVIPYYFCVTDVPGRSITLRYGEHVSDAVDLYSKSTTTPIVIDKERLCRPEIKLNHLKQDVYFYDFFPGNSDLVLLKLEDGLYVTEIDDRAWQNTQLIYPGNKFKVVIENDIIYIFEDGQYFELITTIDPI